MATDRSEVKYHFLDFWRVLVNRRGWFLSIFIIAFSGVVAVTWFSPKIYLSTVTIEILPLPEGDVISHAKPDTESSADDFLISQIASLQQKDILYQVIDFLRLNERWAVRDGIAGDPYPRETTYQMLLKTMKIFSDGAPLLQIQLETRSPEEGVEICNAIVEAYQHIRVVGIKEKHERERDRLQESIKQQQEAIRVARAEVERIRIDSNFLAQANNETGSSNLNTNTDLELKNKEDELSQAKLNLVDQQKRTDQLNALSAAELTGVFLTMNIQTGEIQNLQHTIQTNETIMAKLKQEGYDVNHPKVNSVVETINQTRKQLESLVLSIREGLLAELKILEAKIVQMEADLEQFRAQAIISANEKSPLFAEAVRNVQKQQEILINQETNLKQNQLELQSLPPALRVRSPAESNPHPIKPDWKWNLGGGAVLAFLLGLSVVLFREYLDRSVKSIYDIEQELEIPVLAVIPKGVPTLNLEPESSPHSEGYRILRAKIESLRQNDRQNSITMVSGGPGEGKSTTLFNLAWVFAQSGMRTLLVDTDLRRPALHQILGLQNNVGLAQLLLGNPPLEHVITGTPLETLHFMPSGSASPHVLSLLNSPRMLEIMEDLKSRYDWVLFDAPPILGVSDATILVRKLDITVMVIQQGRYPLDVARRVKKSVLTAGGNLVGAVFNQVDTNRHEIHGFYTAYYDYYGTVGEKEKRKRATSSAKARKKSKAPVKEAARKVVVHDREF